MLSLLHCTDGVLRAIAR